MNLQLVPLARVSPAVAPSLRLRRVSVREYIGWTSAFAGLAARAADPNPHMSPAGVQAVSTTFFAPEDVVILVVSSVAQPERLVGVWALGRSRPAWALGLAVLKSPILPIYEVLSHPVIESGLVEPVLRLMLAHLADDPLLPGLIRCTSLAVGGETGGALLRLLPELGGRFTAFERWERAMFEPAASCSPEAYLRGSMGRSYRRCRSKRRALERSGAVQFAMHRRGDAVAALPRFLQLEASGWKGRNGTAMGSVPRHAAYATAVVAALTEADEMAIAELSLAGRPVAMALLPSSAGTVCFAKTTYDEHSARFSPGVLLDIEITAGLLADPSFRLMDSGMDDSMDAGRVIWAERRRMAHGLIALGAAPADWIASGGLALRQRIRAARQRYAAG